MITLADNYFVCNVCRYSHPMTEIGRHIGHKNGGLKVCKSCDKKAAANKLNLNAGIKRRTAKAAAKKYREGKLPKWMYS